MTLGELQAWVLRTMKRPELASQALDCINGAIEFAATNGDYAFDLIEGQTVIDPLLYAQSYTISTEFPKFRKMKYLRPVGYSRYLNWRDPSRIFDANGCEATNVFYRAGDNLVFKLSSLMSDMLYGYFAYPTFFTPADVDLTSPYTEQMPTAIHDLAVARMWDEIGNDAESQRAERRGLKLLQMHKADKQDAVSYS